MSGTGTRPAPRHPGRALPHRGAWEKSRDRVERSCPRGRLCACTHMCKTLIATGEVVGLHRDAPQPGPAAASQNQLSFQSIHTAPPRAGASNPKPSLCSRWSQPVVSSAKWTCVPALEALRRKESAQPGACGGLDHAGSRKESSWTRRTWKPTPVTMSHAPLRSCQECSDPHPTIPGSPAGSTRLPSTSPSQQTSPQLRRVLAANRVAKLHPRLPGGGQAGAATDRGFHS